MSPLVSLILWNSLLAGGLGILVWLMQRLAWFKSRPGLSHFLWLVVLLKLIVPPIYNVSLPSQLFNQPPNHANSGSDFSIAVGSDVGSKFVAVPDRMSRPLTGMFAVLALSGSAVILVICVSRTRRIARLVRLADPAPQWLLDVVATLAEELEVRQHVAVVTIDACVSPFLWVTRRGPSIVIPSALASKLQRENLLLIVRHELQHYVRRDHWTNLFSMAVGVIAWWNPVVWWARRELRFAQELCCDASVLATDHRKRRRYAETLLQTIDFVSSDEATVPVPTTAFGSCSTFKRRIEMISQRDLSSRVPYVARILALPLAGLLIATTPSLAHDDDQSETIADMRGQIRELRAAVKNLELVIRDLTKQNRREGREEDNRRDNWLTRERIMGMAERADLNEKERRTLFQMAESVDGNPRQFERLLKSEDLNDRQAIVLEKLMRDRDERREGREKDNRRDNWLTRERIMGMAERADLNEKERRILFQLAESVDGNPRQFERLWRSDDLNDKQAIVLEKLARDRDEGREEDNRRDNWLTRERIMSMAERADLNEKERHTLFQMAESVDGNPRQFERLLKSDDLNDKQAIVLEKLARDHDEDRRD